jgi:hypothetical protein
VWGEDGSNVAVIVIPTQNRVTLFSLIYVYILAEIPFYDICGRKYRIICIQAPSLSIPGFSHLPSRRTREREREREREEHTHKKAKAEGIKMSR